MKELISNDLINRIRESKSNAEARRYILTALQKAKQKEVIEESTNLQMKEEQEFYCECHNSGVNSLSGRCDRCRLPKKAKEQPELSAEEFKIGGYCAVCLKVDDKCVCGNIIGESIEKKSAEEFLKSKGITSFEHVWDIWCNNGGTLADLLTEFKNQNG